MTFDGINENGVAMNSNVVPAIDMDFATLLSTNYGKPVTNKIKLALSNCNLFARINFLY